MFSFYSDPVIIKNIVTESECEFFINYEAPLLKNKFGDNLGGDDIVSFNKKIPKCEHTVKQIIRKCSDIIHLPYENFEDLNVVKYEKGGFIAEYQDLNPTHTNFRMYTFLLCLKDTYEGGDTHFTKLNKSFKLRKGDALLFKNVDSNGHMTELSQHEGKIVKSGEKWICNVWCHKSKY